jgi:hypothetical protein
MGCPASSRRQSGVTVVPQFWHAISSDVPGWSWLCWWLSCGCASEVSHSGGEVCSGSRTVLSCASRSGVEVSGVARGEGSIREMRFVVLATRLLKAGQPLQDSAPPAPLHWPPPGQEPEVCSGGL